MKELIIFGHHYFVIFTSEKQVIFIIYMPTSPENKKKVCRNKIEKTSEHSNHYIEVERFL